jgi:hypothetical protein
VAKAFIIFCRLCTKNEGKEFETTNSHEITLKKKLLFRAVSCEFVVTYLLISIVIQSFFIWFR